MIGEGAAPGDAAWKPAQAVQVLHGKRRLEVRLHIARPVPQPGPIDLYAAPPAALLPALAELAAQPASAAAVTQACYPHVPAVVQLPAA